MDWGKRVLAVSQKGAQGAGLEQGTGTEQYLGPYHPLYIQIPSVLPLGNVCLIIVMLIIFV